MKRWSITEVNADGLMVAKVDFDPDDFEAAIAELDARYLAGEAAAYSHTWSLVAPTFGRIQPARTRRDDSEFGRPSTTAGRPRSSPVT